MSLDDLKMRFLELTGDPVAVGFASSSGGPVDVQYVNAAFTEQFGEPAKDITNDIFEKILDGRGYEALSGPDAAPIAPMDCSVTKTDGTEVWANVRLLVVPDAAACGHYICATYRDITPLKAAEQAALQAGDRVAAALDAYPDPIVIYGEDLRLFKWNSAYAASVGAVADNLKEGMHLTDILRLAVKQGLYPIAIGREEEWIEEIVSSVQSGRGWEDVEMNNSTHYRLLRSRSSYQDYIVIRLNSTDFVQQQREAEEARARLIAALNAYPSPFAIYDPEGCLVVWNSAYAASMTDTPDDIEVGMHFTDVASIAIRAGKIVHTIGNEEEWLTTERQNKEVEQPEQDLELPGDVHHRLLRSRAENGDLVMLRIDTTELMRQRRALEASQARFVSAMNAYPDSFAIYDADQNLLFWNSSFAKSMTDTPEDLEPGVNLKTLLRNAAEQGRIPAAEGRVEEWVEEYYSPDLLAPGTEDFEFANDQHFRMVRSRTESGEHVVLRLNITEVVRNRRTAEENARELEIANREIMHKAYHDDLTGLGNRRHLADCLARQVRQRAREGGEIASLHIDLDRFKQINDTMGHAAGDKVLVETSSRIRAAVGPEDIVARIGGDEFVIVMHIQDDHERPKVLAQTLLNELARPTYFEGKECRFGASIGMARTPLSDTDELLTNSDVALFKAKRNGRGQLGVFDRSDLEEVRKNKTLADDILRAIEQGEFVPYYQPQVDAKTGEIVGLEALSRWDHPTRGILSPIAFLQVATDLNVVSEIDRMIFERAIAECGPFFSGTAAPPSLSFNVSANRVNAENFEAIQSEVRNYPGQVCFELLETIFLEEESEQFLFQLDRLREIGIELEVDDFGSGRASIVALQRIGPDRLKIDRRLVAPIGQSAKSHHLLRSIVEIGLALDMGVTAEGVETQEQAEILAQLGCDRLQGYHFSMPLSFAELTPLFVQRKRIAN